MDMSSDAEELATYLKSMPLAYRAAFDDEAARAHQAIVRARRRGDRAVHVEIWRELSGRVVAVCVVADDKPGLLSCISAALLAHRIDVVGAHAYCRTRDDGAVEAVDILWIRRLPGPKNLISPIRTRHIAALADAIERAVLDARDADGEIGIVPPPPSSSELLRTGETAVVAEPRLRADPNVTASARIRFDTSEEDGATILTVEAVDRPGLLLAVTQALFRAGFQIIGLRATTEGGCAVDRFTLVQADGTPLRHNHLLALQPALLAALDEGAFAPHRLARSTG
jgi:[protein-PII] uridylyltransferase